MRLLFAEDEVELSDAVVAVLKHTNYSVDAVYNGQDAYDYLSAQEYDGAILDIMMPGLDGVEVVKRIRKEGNQVPVIFLTAKSELDDRVLGLDAGADDYLTKPFAMKELLARIRSITRRVGEVTGNTLQFGDLSLDANTYILSCGKQSISLPNKEFQMLEMMMRNPSQILSQDQFMDRIWGLDSETDLSVVWVNISYLRKKIAKLESKVSIKVTRNVGYSLDYQPEK
ncbi:MAG TPA: DNA-binding response regulator [Lachnospiraceae bacterium]|jgi:DNA-binding response OmpR family regulator|nr:DNA-binding response regulator [Lachnospiraceae bacterium]HBE07991.1 DNA-binding response regulator [Lachnospiraceae bacterium]